MDVDLHSVEGLACHANGQVTLSGPLLRLEHDLDRLFLAWAVGCGAAEYRFPPLLAARELDRIDYFRSFPHLATFPASLPPDESSLRAFAASHAIASDGSLRPGALAPLREVLVPAACYPVYAHYRGAALDAPVHLTTRATCFRREHSYAPLARQWAFAMREIVCLGTREETLGLVSRLRTRLDAFARAIDLPLRWEDATDPFFDPSRSPKRLLQRLAPAKQEMVFGAGLALGSANLHRTYFGEAFDIERNGRPAFSACVAFGIERWILAFLERFGPTPDGWPDLEAHHAR
jgi:seryl-tRNA synthetase